MRKDFEITDEQLNELIKNSSAFTRFERPAMSPKEYANYAWGILGLELGFNPKTVRPISGKSYRFFNAECVDAGSTCEEKSH